jgi:hypothetical protein
VDWNGNWLPGDVEWDIRKPYTNRHFTTYIDGWLTGIEKAYGVVYADGKIKADQNFGFVNIKAPPYVGSWEEGGEIALRPSMRNLHSNSGNHILSVRQPR